MYFDHFTISTVIQARHLPNIKGEVYIKVCITKKLRKFQFKF